MHGPSKTMGLANCCLISLDTFSCYMHLAVYLFRELSQNLDFVQGQESLEVPICLFVMSEHLASAFKTLKSRSHSLKSQISQVRKERCYSQLLTKSCMYHSTALNWHTTVVAVLAKMTLA